jgi:site-specific recombinase XerD
VDSVADQGVDVEDVLRFVGAAEGSLRHDALTKSSWKSYKCGIRRWLAFARIRGLDPLQPDVDTLGDCIEHYNEAGMTPSAIDLMCTAVSTIFAWKTNVRLGQQEQIKSLIRATNARQKIVPQPRYYFEPLTLLGVVERDASGASLRTMLWNLATLLVLCHAMRFSEMEGILRREIKFGTNDECVEVMITLKTEQRRKRRIVIGKVGERPGVCVVSTLRGILGGEDTGVPELFAVRIGAAYKKLSASQIALLVREVMDEAGIPKEVHPYNAKHVGLTKAWEAGATEDELRDVARWAKNSEQFRRHYRVRDATDRVVRLIIDKGEGEKKKPA